MRFGIPRYLLFACNLLILLAIVAKQLLGRPLSWVLFGMAVECVFVGTGLQLAKETKRVRESFGLAGLGDVDGAGFGLELL